MIFSISTPNVDWFTLSPSLALLDAAAVALLAAVLVPRGLRRPVAALAAAGGFAGAFAAAALVYGYSSAPVGEVAQAVSRDRWAGLAQMIVAGAGVVAVGISYGERMKDDHVAEFYSLFTAAGAGMAFLVSANNLLTLFLGLEWFSICLYVLCAIDVGLGARAGIPTFEADDADGARAQPALLGAGTASGGLVGSLEAGLKYLIIGGFGSAFLLFGSALAYAATGGLRFGAIATAVGARGLTHDVVFLTGLAMIIAGLGFKASAAPFHMWTPDVYEGAPTPVTAFMSAATKTVALVLALRVLSVTFPQERHLWTVAVAVIACASLAVGNLAALVQRSVKRMLAYSSISHAGFMLIAIAAANALGGRALLYYLIPYSAMSLGAFAVVAARERELGVPVTVDNLAGFGWERPFLGVAMWTFMLGFAGFPLTGGFVGKFYVFAAAYKHGWIWLVIVGVAATAVSLYYYLGIVRALYMRPAAGLEAAAVGGSPPPERLLQASVFVCLVVTVGSFFAVQPLIELARDAASALPL